MANTTDFFTCPKRTVYQNNTPQVQIPDTLIPTTENTSIPATTDIVFDFGEMVTFSHVYVQHESIASLQMIAQSDLMGSTPVPLATFTTQANESEVHDIPGATTISTQYLRFVATAVPSQTPMLLSLVPMNLLVRFQDGAFNQIGFKPMHRTRGHHKMMKGGLRPYQGLGIETREMTFGSEHIPYVWSNANPAGGTDENGNPLTYSHDEIFRLADITKINSIFRNHLEFIFADNIDVYPDRIFKASFKENSLDEPFSTDIKEIGYDVGFTVCEA